ncbi:hypothetical protein E3U43_002498 [Larimichthys crocea]|uniref:Uncharacterized protein n=1 Tax=Larimichthys crocea TaxID=215358 RepID=A0ACD3QRV1_LARCR|nr:hypothetical protein E3U43_002498 [Larimichthys crocea]
MRVFNPTYVYFAREFSLCYHSISYGCCNADDPGSYTGTYCTPLPPYRFAWPVENHCYETIHGYGSQQNDTTVHTYNVCCSHKFAGQVTKDPVVQRMDSPEWKCDSEDQIRADQVHDEQISDIFQVLIENKNT